MSGANKHFVYEILFTLFHTGNASAASALSFINVYRHSLDIADICVCHNTVLNRDKILDVNFSAYRFNLSSSVITVFSSDFGKLVFNYLMNLVFVCKYCFQFFNFLHQFI